MSDLVHAVSHAVAKSPTDKIEKTRQSLASKNITYIYQYIFAGVLFVLLLRNIAHRSRHYLARRRRRLDKSFTAETPEEGDSPSPALYTNESWFFRALGAVDAKAGSQVGLKLFSDCTWFRLIAATLVCALNLTFCLIVDTALRTPASPNSNIARAFSRRCGRMAAANFPLLFILTGRNNLVTMLTGFAYQEVRFMHKLIGVIVLLETLIHTFAYTGYYIVSLGVEKLHEEYTELYFKMGIVAVVAGLMIAITSVPYIRRKWYEVFLAVHVVGAAIFLSGAWYHRPIMENWVYAAVAFWVFDRLARVASHVVNVLHARVVLRAPLLTATATVNNGAILLSVPFPSASGWESGQHVYISFWGKHLLSSPWLYGQSHPFSISNLPVEENNNELKFVLRIHNGITRALATYVETVSKNSGGKSASITCSMEGPYGRAPDTDHYDSVLLVAGGSGITHVAGVLEEVVRKAKAGESVTKEVELVWAVHHLQQMQWLSDSLINLRLYANQYAPSLSLKMNVFVTRAAGSHSGSSSVDTLRSSSSTKEDEESVDEKKAEQTSSSYTLMDGSGVIVHHGRPDVAACMAKTVSSSPGYSLVIACGPTSLAKVVKETSTSLASAAMHVQVASFES